MKKKTLRSELADLEVLLTNARDNRVGGGGRKQHRAITFSEFYPAELTQVDSLINNN